MMISRVVGSLGGPTPVHTQRDLPSAHPRGEVEPGQFLKFPEASRGGVLKAPQIAPAVEDRTSRLFFSCRLESLGTLR